MSKTATKAEERVLTTLDRCDSCGVQAKIIFTFLNGELMFCGHHSKERKGALLKQAVSVYDPQNILI